MSHYECKECDQFPDSHKPWCSKNPKNRKDTSKKELPNE